jgi:heme exporter protein A
MAGEAERQGFGRLAILAGRALDCRRGERIVFSGLDFDLAAGELLLLRGPNGSGKTSLLRLIAGLIAPERGMLTWRGAPIADPEVFRAELAYLGHADAAKPELTVREDLVFWQRMRCRSAGAEGAARSALEPFGLTELADLPCRLLTAGQRRRLALARIAASGATLWLLDEPFNALDESALAAAAKVIGAHLAAGGLAVMAAHGSSLPLAPARVLDLGRLLEAAPA